MFSDEIVGVVDFPSSWRKERAVAHSASQTREIFTEERAVQALQKSHRDCQTEVDDKEQKQAATDDNSAALLKFLRRVEPVIAAALQKSATSTAFDGYGTDRQQEVTAPAEAVHTLAYGPFISSQLAVTAVSWNSSGSVVAASYGKLDHEDWCTHKSGLCTWNLNRRGLDCDKPDTVLDVDSCVMTVAFHPKNPALVAGGTFNGEVCVWNLSKETDSLVASSGLGERTHRDPVSKVVWLTGTSAARTKHEKLMSVSLDGKMLVWTLNEEKRSLELSDGFVLTAKSMPKSTKVKSAHKGQEMGVTSIAFSPEDNNIFYLGSESGGLFKCSMDARHDDISVDLGGVQLKSPVSFSFLPHSGPAYSVHCSPFHRNLFLTCSSDMSVRLHTALQSQPVLVLEPSCGIVFSARWSPTRPLVFAVTTEHGRLLFYDLKVSQTTPVLSLDVVADRKAVYAVEFNRQQRRLLATGDALGNLKIWHLSDDLTSEAPSERELLNSFDMAAAQD